jgi:hypothetical protein
MLMDTTVKTHNNMKSTQIPSFVSPRYKSITIAVLVLGALMSVASSSFAQNEYGGDGGPLTITNPTTAAVTYTNTACADLQNVIGADSDPNSVDVSIGGVYADGGLPASWEIDNVPLTVGLNTIEADDEDGNWDIITVYWTACPALNIVDEYGDVISSANSNDRVIVGQAIDLYGVPDGTFSNFQWSVDGYVISNYIVSTGMLYTNVCLTNSDIGFYWVDGGSKQVTCTAFYRSNQLSTNVTFTVVRPTAQITPFTTSVNVFGGYLQFACPSPLKDGITFSNTLSVPGGFSGTSVWSQIVTSTSRIKRDTGGTDHVFTHSCEPPYGDLPTPYLANDGNNSVDSPGLVLPFSGYVRVSVGESFQMYMLFQPSDGICVPLRAVDWSWSGVATNSGSTWGFESGTGSASSDSDTTSFPQWNCAVSDGDYLP